MRAHTRREYPLRPDCGLRKSQTPVLYETASRKIRERESEQQLPKTAALSLGNDSCPLCRRLFTIPGIGPPLPMRSVVVRRRMRRPQPEPARRIRVDVARIPCRCASPTGPRKESTAVPVTTPFSELVPFHTRASTQPYGGGTERQPSFRRTT
jgi:hypothetical protein